MKIYKKTYTRQWRLENTIFYTNINDVSGRKSKTGTGISHHQIKCFLYFFNKMVEQATITEDEAQLYDRQIRLWGLDAQRRYFLV